MATGLVIASMFVYFAVVTKFSICKLQSRFLTQMRRFTSDFSPLFVSRFNCWQRERDRIWSGLTQWRNRYSGILKYGIFVYGIGYRSRDRKNNAMKFGLWKCCSTNWIRKHPKRTFHELRTAAGGWKRNPGCKWDWYSWGISYITFVELQHCVTSNRYHWGNKLQKFLICATD